MIPTLLPSPGIHSHVLIEGAECHDLGEAEARFPYWSFSKTIIAICAHRMAQRGVVDLDQPIEGFSFTLRQVLDHTSGLSD